MRRAAFGLLLSLAFASPAPAETRAPDAHAQAVLIYTAILALDQANATDNYAVLRGLAAPAFQERNSSESLRQIFARYRELKVGLGEAVLFEPRLLGRPAVDASGMLRLSGYFPTRPLRIGFDLSFIEVEGAWRLIAISVNPAPAP
jgi:hypothetical protein